jgi:electron transfer flavoprotein alpha subunit
MSQNVLVITEYAQDRFRQITYESLSTGKQLADELGGQMAAAVLGANVEADAAKLWR